MSKLTEKEKKIAAKEFKERLRKAEKRIYRKIKARMEQLKKDNILKARQEKEIQEWLTEDTKKDTEKKTKS